MELRDAADMDSYLERTQGQSIQGILLDTGSCASPAEGRPWDWACRALFQNLHHANATTANRT